MPSRFTGRATAFGTQRRGGRWWILLIIVIVVGAGVLGYYSRSFVNESLGGDVQGDAGEGQPSPILTGPILSDGGGTLEADLEGVAFFNARQYDDSIKWFNDYLSGGVKVPRADAALYYLGKACFKKGDPSQMSAAWKRLAEEFPRSEYTAKVLFDTARLTPDADERTRALYLAWKGFPSTKEGKLAALDWADEAYELYAGNIPDYSKWEDIWAAYSVALEDPALKLRPEIVKKVERIASYLVLNPTAMPQGAFKVQVEPGDSVSVIAHRNHVPVGSIMRMNGLRSDVIQPGDELKVYPVKAGIVVDRSRFKLTLHINRRFFNEYTVGVGKGELTPAGSFSIAKRVRMPTWFRGSERLSYGHPENILGTRWMGFGRSGPGKGLGIHGSTQPETIPGDVSQGCIRMLNRDVEEVYDLAPPGTEVVIL